MPFHSRQSLLVQERKRSMLTALHKMHLLSGSMRELRPSSFPASKLLFHTVLDVRWSLLFAVNCLANATGDSEGFDAAGGTLKFAKFHPPLADAGGNFNDLRRQLAMQGRSHKAMTFLNNLHGKCALPAFIKKMTA